jgi:hypothetical protein
MKRQWITRIEFLESGKVEYSGKLSAGQARKINTLPNYSIQRFIVGSKNLARQQAKDGIK